MNNRDNTIAGSKQNMNNKGNKKRHNKSLTDINEEQILNFVQREFIKAYFLHFFFTYKKFEFR